jgi:hypothetical protein
MTFFKITKQSPVPSGGEEGSEEQSSTEQNNKGNDETTVRRQASFKTDTKPKQRKGTITITVSTASVQDIARFQLTDPELFQRTIDIITSVLSQINDPQLEISGDCNCIWCQQKIAEFKEALSS